MNKTLASVLAGGLITGLSIMGVQPASAAGSWITVCNSADGYARIAATSYGAIGVGNCTAWPLNNTDGQVRVDTDPDGPSHSYKIKPDGGSYGPCHTNSDNHSSDPPNVTKVYYKNYNHGDCTN